MTAKLHTTANRITIPLKNGIKVIYDDQQKTVEVINGTKLEVIQDAPKNYSVAQVMQTINKVQDYYNQ